MALTAALTTEYLRAAQQQQTLYAYWLADGDVARASLAMNVANWYYQQLGFPLYSPSDLATYVPAPVDPTTASALAAALPVDVSGPAITSAAGSNAGGSTSRTPGALGNRTSTGGFPTAQDATSYCNDNPYDPICFSNSGGSILQDSEYCQSFPDDPLCWTAGGILPGGGDGGGAPIIVDSTTTINIDQTGLTIGDVTSKIAGALGSAAAAIAGAVDTALAKAVAAVQQAINALGNALASVFKELARLAGYILQFLKGLLLDVIHGLVAAVQEIGKLLKDVFTNVLMPALQALQKLRNYLIQIYERFLRPLLIWLQRARQILAILKAFHIGFATKLDNAIADIQSKISTPLLYLLQYTNAVANYINLILDARLLLQKPLWLNSFNAYAGSSLNLQLNAMNTTPDPAALAALKATPAIPAPAQSAAATTQLLSDGGGDYAPIVASQSSQLDAYLLQGFE